MGDSWYRRVGHLGTSGPRSFRVIVGGLLACGGMLYGVLVTLPRYHRAASFGVAPVEMTWEELTWGGLFDNAHVRLLDVAIEAPSGGFDVTYEQLCRRLDDRQAADLVMRSLPPLKVHPRGVDFDSVDEIVVVPRREAAVHAARAEVSATGHLTGYLQTQPDEAIGRALLGLFGLPSAVPQRAEYIYCRPDSVPPVGQARFAFAATVLAVAMGLVICGSGSPSWLTCLMCPPAALLSLLGGPLRYGRANSRRRLVCAVIGAGLAAYGCQRLFGVGRLGFVGADPLDLAGGFLALCLAAGALLGAAVSLLAARYGRFFAQPDAAEREDSPASVSEPSPGFTRASYSRRYIDPKFTVLTDVRLCAAMKGMADTFERIDFESPLAVEVIDDDCLVTTTVQVGCQNMALAIVEAQGENEGLGGTVRARLVSILDDGFVLITCSQNFPHLETACSGSCGQYEVSSSNDPVEMLSGHLEQIVSTAEERGASPVSLESGEWRDVYLLASRVLADIRRQTGESNRAVDEAVHGRFRFPLAPVNQAAPCGV